ncbi:MAG: CPBP family intramembrane metalloprotease [Spirochaetaceae bacterium]|nr:MAG: CPBP family intramembrane metalloprotease [Spirochaetaceae bacterium]
MIENRKETFLYIALTYAITALSWGSLAILQLPATESIPAVILYLLGGFSTVIVAVFIVLRRGKNERRYYLRCFFRFRLSPWWYVMAVASATLVVGLAYGVTRILFPVEVARLSLQPFFMVIPFFFMMVFGGGIEEFGWRGIVVQNMRAMNPVSISLIVGVIWFVWHLPLFFIVGVGQYQAPMLPFFLGLMGYSFVTTALYLKTESVVPCLIFHALVNAFGELGFWVAAETPLAYWDSAVRLVVGIGFFALIVSAKNRRALTT